MSYNGFSPTQERILRVLSDGQPHEKKELLECLDELSRNISNLRVHIHTIRKKLKIVHEDIACVVDRRRHCYRHVRILRVE